MLSRRRLLMSALAPAPPTRVLIIDGVNNHDWQAATAGIRSMLGDPGRFTVLVSTTPPVESAEAVWNAWRPSFSNYHVVIVNFNSGHTRSARRWPRGVEEAFESYVRRGGGFVSFHAANNAFLEWQAYNELVGLLWRDKEFGRGLVVDDSERVIALPVGTGSNPGHGPRHSFEMVVRDPRHPVTEGLPKRWRHPSEQLTHGQHGPANDLTILTYAMSEVTQRNEPMDWVRTYGNGRVYVTMLGHTWRDEPNPNLDAPEFRRMFAQGVQWAGGLSR